MSHSVYLLLPTKTERLITGSTGWSVPKKNPTSHVIENSSQHTDIAQFSCIKIM